MNRIAFLFVVCALGFLVTSCGVARQSYEDAQVKVREAALETTLSQMRDVLKQYELDQGNPPRKIDDIVTVGYINRIPEDPITGKTDWVLVTNNCPPEPSNCTTGIVNIRSASKNKSTRGDLYSDW